MNEPAVAGTTETRFTGRLANADLRCKSLTLSPVEVSWLRERLRLDGWKEGAALNYPSSVVGDRQQGELVLRYG